MTVGQRRRLTIDSIRSNFIAFSSSEPGGPRSPIGDHAPITNSEIGAHNRQRPVIVFADTAVEISACSAASQAGLRPWRVQPWHFLRSTRYEPSFIQILKAPLMFIFTASA